MRLIATLLPIALLAACGSQQSGTVTDENGDETRFTIDNEGTNTQIRATGADGEQVVVNAGEGAGSVLPLGFTTYPGAAVVSNSTIETNDGKGSVLFMTTPDSPAKVAAFYRAQAEAAGIAIAMQTTNNTAHTIAGEGDGGKNFLMTASPGPEGTGVQLMVGQEPGN